MTQHTFKVDTRLPILLSENYRSPEKAIKELVDNAWDADAEIVEVTLPEPFSAAPIIIEDNGTGMTISELESEYLNIARNRRSRSGEFTRAKRRKVKGSKGIGKFAGLMTASAMTLITYARGSKSTFNLDKRMLENHDGLVEMPLGITESASTEKEHGTRIVLSDLNQNLSFPSPERLRQLLIAEYGREDDFKIIINGKPLDIDDLRGEFKEVEITSDLIGKINLRCTVTDTKQKLRKPGISIRFNGKVIGDPSFFGLDKAEDIPSKLLSKCFGEIEINGPIDDVTADWGAIIEGSKTEQELYKLIAPILREQLKAVYGQEIQLAQARLKKEALERISKLPENRRVFAEKAIQKILEKFYQEPTSKLEPIVNVILDAIERDDYRQVLEHINEAKHSDVARFAEALEEFGFVEIAMVAEQANHRLRFIDSLEEICNNQETLEKHVHQAIENNLWLFGSEHSLFSSNKTLKSQVEQFLGTKYVGDRASKRPDLFLTENLNGERLLIEFKRPSHTLVFEDYQQTTAYRNDFHQNGIDNQINIVVIGGKLGSDLPIQDRREPKVKIMTFSDLISNSRRQYEWLLTNN